MTDRQQQILAILADAPAATIKSLAGTLYVSEASVRRDIARLEQEGMVHRVYGGVMLATRDSSVVPLSMRDGEHSAQKEHIARMAAALVPDGATIMLDASSTVRRMVKYLSERKRLTIITNNERIFSELGASDATVYCTGGLYHRENHAFAGPAAEAFLRTVSADMLFFSSQGISPDGEITDFSESETALRRVMLERAAKRICLMDSSKLGVRGTFHLCNLDAVDILLSEKPLEGLCPPRPPAQGL